MTLLSLRAGRLALDLAPQAGGSIARFTWDTSVDVLRAASAEALASGRGNDTACYPLVPFSNRIANGRFAFEGGQIVVAPNWPGQRHPMHGDGWAHAWRVVRSDGRSAEEIYEHDGAEGWPFRYCARQAWRLDEQALSVEMSLENLESRDIPAGLGLHPFFTRDPDTELVCRAEGVWLADAEVLPTKRIAVPPEWDFTTPRRVNEVVLDNCFDGWDGHASIVWPRRRLRLDLEASEPFRHLVIFVPPGRPFFCVEPVSHANGQLGATHLAAGARLAGRIVFRLSTL